MRRWQCQDRGDTFGEVSFDASKCFDSLSPSVLIQVAVERGFPPRLGEALGRFFSLAKRFICFNGHVSKQIVMKRGLPQGNALSVCLAILWTNEWFLQANAVLSLSANAVAYLDDMSVASGRRADISAAIGLTSDFLRR